MEKNLDKIVVAYVCDKNYLPFLRKSIQSVKRHNKNVEFVVMSDCAIPIKDVKVFRVNKQQIHRYFVKNSRMNEGVFYKFFLPKLPYDKVIYMDCDVYCQHSLNELWNIDCPFILATESHIYGNEQAKELGLQRYAITGMMVMNLKALRECKFTDKCLKCFSENPKVKFHDETIINMQFNTNITFIDKKFNYCHNRVYQDPIKEEDAVLLHYVGHIKEKIVMLRRLD